MSKANKMLAAAAMVMCLAPAMTWAAENDSDDGLFGLMGLVGMQNRNRRRRTGTAQGGTNGRTH